MDRILLANNNAD